MTDEQKLFLTRLGHSTNKPISKHLADYLIQKRLSYFIRNRPSY